MALIFARQALHMVYLMEPRTHDCLGFWVCFLEKTRNLVHVSANISIILLAHKNLSEHAAPYVYMFMDLQINCMHYESIIYIHDKAYINIGIF